MAPRFGGFCALGVAKNALLHGNPEAWSIGADQALFLFCCDAAKQAWARDPATNRADAERAWPVLAGSAAGARRKLLLRGVRLLRAARRRENASAAAGA